MYLASISLYRVNYGEDDLTVPALGDPDALLPDPMMTFTDVYVGRDEMFSSFKIPAAWSNIYTCNYLGVTVSSSGSSRCFYGWVDDVTGISDVENSFICQVRWHVDQWRTFISSATMGYGLVTRRFYDSTDLPGVDRPVQNIPFVHQHLHQGNRVPVCKPIRSSESATGKLAYVMHCIMAYIDDSLAERASVKYALWPVGFGTSLNENDRPDFTDIVWFRLSTDINDTCPSFGEVFEGDTGTAFRIKSENVKGLWLSFVPPFDFEFRKQGDYYTAFYRRPNSALDVPNDGRLNRRAFIYNAEQISRWSSEQTVTVPDFISNEIDTYAMFDENGDVVAQFPVGVQCLDGLKARLAVSAAGCYQIFRPVLMSGRDYTDSSAEGCDIRLPCIQVPVTSNSWSNYVYSGQREYEISTRRLNIDTAFYKGVMGAGSSAGQGAMAGAIAGNSTAAPLAALGAGAGILSSAGGAIVDRLAADQLQNMADAQKVKQSDALMFFGASLGSFAFAMPCFGPFFGSLRIDAYSLDKWEKHVRQYGIEDNTTVTDLSSYLTGYNGPVQVVNAEIGGAPNDAVRYIKRRLERGVIIKSS